MKTKSRQYDKRGGSALVLVVVVTVLLAVVGVMFLMVSRASELETAAVVKSKDLDNAVDAVVTRIGDVLVDDLFGINPLRPGIVDADDTYLDADEPWDFMTHNPQFPAGTWSDPIGPGLNGVLDPTVPVATNDDIWLPGYQDDYWLASLVPEWLDAGQDGKTGTVADMLDDTYAWPHITDLWGTLQGRSDSLYYQRYINSDHKFYPQTTSVIWIDPDYTTYAPTDIWFGWDNATKWARWEVSAYNVRAKVIQPNDRMDVAAIINPFTSPTIPSSWATAAAETGVDLYGARADADGDGVADSRWVPVPGLTTSRGEPVYTAVRIIDNCAMLNLNGAHCFNQEPYTTTSPLFKDGSGDPVSPFSKAWFENVTEYSDFVSDQGAGFDTFKQYLYHKNFESGSGHYLTEINYLPFLRGNDLSGDFFGGDAADNWYDLMIFRNMYDTVTPRPFTPQECSVGFIQLETLLSGFHFFDISDELELRNRHLLTSLTESRIEQKDVLNYTLDSGGATYIALQLPVNLTDFNYWKERVDPAYFSTWDSNGNYIPNTDPLAGYRYKYDRRPLCTVYSYDRSFRRGTYPLLDSEIQAYANANWAAAGFTSAAEYKQYLLNAWGPFFIPIGPVTTDIQNPASAQPYNNTETRRRILHLLFALREYFLPDKYETMDLLNLTAAEQAQLDSDRQEAALKAAQIVANLIDYSDDDAIVPTSVDRQGPFYPPVITMGPDNIDYGQQANVDCTFITEDIIEGMIAEVSGGLIPVGILSFGLDPDPMVDIVFGYEKQPFISEVYAKRNTSTGVLEGFAVELLNPYTEDIELVRDDTTFLASEDIWRIKVGDGSLINNPIAAGVGSFIPMYDVATSQLGRYVIRTDNTVTLALGSVALTYDLSSLSNMGPGNYEIQLLRPAPEWVSDNLGIDFIVVDWASADAVDDLWNTVGENAIKRIDYDWQFIYADDDFYRLQDDSVNPYIHTLGIANTVPSMADVPVGFQIGVADDSKTSLRWHDLEVMGLYGNAPEDDPASAVTTKLADPNLALFHFDLDPGHDPNNYDLFDYIATINRPDYGTVPGRININTAPVHVIAAAIPPTLADPDAADPSKVVTLSALQLAQKIVDYRENTGPFETISDLLNIPEFEQYIGAKVWGVPDAENVGMQSIEEDIEEEHWVLSCLANKFTVRSDVFTAYILVRLGTDGPQRRMIAIFDRSGVWSKTDRPKLVALHPVPDPR